MPRLPRRMALNRMRTVSVSASAGAGQLAPPPMVPAAQDTSRIQTVTVSASAGHSPMVPSATPATQNGPELYTDRYCVGFHRRLGGAEMPRLPRGVALRTVCRDRCGFGLRKRLQCRNATPATQNGPELYTYGYIYGFRRRLPEWECRSATYTQNGLETYTD